MGQGGTRNSVDGAVVAGPVVQAGTIGQLHVHAPPPPPAPAAEPGAPRDPWTRAVAESGVWRQVPADRDTQAHRRYATAVAARLAELREGPAAALAGDPWSDEAPEAHSFTLQYLHHTAIRRRTGIADVVELIRRLGVPVPDPAGTIRAALARVPRALPCDQNANG
ncbi:hypothetical protein [Streptomyces sp. NPDC004788]